jgi:subtilisin family serine protease
MRRMQYYSTGKLVTILLQGMLEGKPKARSARRARAMVAPQAARTDIVGTLQHQKKRLATRFADVTESTMALVPSAKAHSTVIPTETVAVLGARRADVKWAADKHGFEVIEERRRGRWLLKAPGDGDAIATTFRVSRELYKRRSVRAAHPNFLRVLQRPAPSSSGMTQQWALANDGRPGLIGADVHALAAWTITKGSKEIRVAVLDEGVDTRHPYLKSAVVAERDFVDGNAHARPNGNDAHGTACAGIIVSQNKKLRGLARDVRLVAARIAKSDDRGFWVFDDFATADAIEWCWAEAKADVLSNSWGGGPASDVIIEAINEARERGRSGKGSVVVFAAGNSQAPVDFPGNLSGVLTVGASNQWDERKTTSSKDGETWWGSNYGDALDLLAPGVRIKTTDIRGGRGYDKTLVTLRFNGTSSATPHVAATAGLMLSVKPALKEQQVREIIRATADPLTRSGKPNRLVGHGRLNAYAALWAARRC